MPRVLIALCCLVSLWLSGCSDSSSSSPRLIRRPRRRLLRRPPRRRRRNLRRRRSSYGGGLTRTRTCRTRVMRRSTDGRCRRSARAACDYADLIEGIYAAGGYVKTRGLDHPSSAHITTGGDGHVQVHQSSQLHPTEYVEAAGGPLQTLARRTHSYIVTLHRHGDVVGHYQRIEQVAAMSVSALGLATSCHFRRLVSCTSAAPAMPKPVQSCSRTSRSSRLISRLLRPGDTVDGDLGDRTIQRQY